MNPMIAGEECCGNDQKSPATGQRVPSTRRERGAREDSSSGVRKIIAAHMKAPEQTEEEEKVVEQGEPLTSSATISGPIRA